MSAGCTTLRERETKGRNGEQRHNAFVSGRSMVSMLSSASGLSEKKIGRRSIDLSAFEDWIESVPHHVDVASWRHSGLDIWPLCKTTLLGLGILSRIEQPKRGVPTGGLGWRAGVIADYFILSGLRRMRGVKRSIVAPASGLADTVVYYASGGHSRDMGGLFVTPSLDIPAALLEATGYRSVFWHENLKAGDVRLDHSLFADAFGVAGLLAEAKAHAVRGATQQSLSELPGFLDATDAAARHLMLKGSFLRLWLARQINLALGVATVFDAVFARSGRPRLLVILNSCVWSTTGLVAAAKRQGIPVVEVHHGAESRSAVTAPNQFPHFSSFNTTPDALVSWECDARDDDRVFAAGPLGLQLNALIKAREGSGARFSETFSHLIQEQEAALAQRVEGRFRHELLITLQPGNDDRWVVEVMRALPDDVFVWVRLHTMDRERKLAIPEDISHRLDTRLGTSSFLHLLLERIAVHITGFSGVTLEAAAMGVPTIALDAYAADLYAAHVPANALYIEPTSAGIAARVIACLAPPVLRQGSRLPDLSGLPAFIAGVVPRPDASEASHGRG